MLNTVWLPYKKCFKCEISLIFSNWLVYKQLKYHKIKRQEEDIVALY